MTVTPYDVPAGKLVEEAAKDLKENVKLRRPDWSLLVKTGADKERIPDSGDWWWTRAASVLRKAYVGDKIGVGRMRKIYGSRKNRGVKPEKFYPSGGKVIRTILQEFDELGFTKKREKSSGRTITKKGIEYLDKIAERTFAASKAKDV